MSLITKNATNGKVKYTLKEDIIITTMANEGSSVSDISKRFKELGLSRSEASIQYRIGRKLSKVDSFEALHGVKADTVQAAQIEVDALLNPENAGE